MSDSSGGGGASAGWYPVDDTTQRYWDGTAWTEHVAPLTAAGAPPSEPEVTPSAPVQQVAPTPQYSAPEQYAPAPYAAPQQYAAAQPAPQYSAPQYSAPQYSAPQYSSPQYSTTPFAAAPRRRVPLWPFFLGGGALLLLIVLGVGGVFLFSALRSTSSHQASGTSGGSGDPSSGSSDASSFALSGVLLLDRVNAQDDGSGGCVGIGDYSDISSSSVMSVESKSGAVLGTAALGTGTLTADGCVYRFTIPDVLGGKGDYYMSMETFRPLKFSEDEARSGQVSIEIGDGG